MVYRSFIVHKFLVLFINEVQDCLRDIMIKYKDGETEGYMNSFSILGNMREAEDHSELFQDLNLDALVKDINEGMEDYDVAPLFRRLPKTKRDVTYRQELLQEIDKEFETELWEFHHAIKRAKATEQELEEMENTSSATHWHLLAAYTYFSALERLVSYVEKRAPKSQGWQEFVRVFREKMTEVVRLQEKVVSTYEAISELRYSFRIEGDHVAILPRIVEEDFLGEMVEKYPHMFPSPNTIPNLLPGSLESTKLEERLYRYLKKKHPDVFRNVETFQMECPTFFHEDVLRFHEEISFYLAYLKFYRYMTASGYDFCFPSFTEKEMSVKDGYDLVLAYQNQLQGKPTIANDYYYGEKERFFIVTGPNRGGKTTFGRSVGQLVYFALLGFPVPAREAKLPYFDGVMTHFSVEESMESGRGKLKEELVRLSDMMQGEKCRQFVIINELFTSAATFDALEMGHRVIQYFMDRECYGIYVTHVDELAKENAQIVSMVAQLVENADHRLMRSYKVVRKPAEGKGYVESIVEQYGLGYHDIVRRLGHV